MFKTSLKQFSGASENIPSELARKWNIHLNAPKTRIPLDKAYELLNSRIHPIGKKSAEGTKKTETSPKQTKYINPRTQLQTSKPKNIHRTIQKNNRIRNINHKKPKTTNIIRSFHKNRHPKFMKQFTHPAPAVTATETPSPP